VGGGCPVTCVNVRVRTQLRVLSRNWHNDIASACMMSLINFSVIAHVDWDGVLIISASTCLAYGVCSVAN